jgi:hypothetical protein
MFTNTVDLNASFLLTYVDKALGFIIIIHRYLWHQLHTRKRNFVLSSNECPGHGIMLKSYFLDFLAIKLPEQTQRSSKKILPLHLCKGHNPWHTRYKCGLGERKLKRSQVASCPWKISIIYDITWFGYQNFLILYHLKQFASSALNLSGTPSALTPTWGFLTLVLSQVVVARG